MTLPSVSKLATERPPNIMNHPPEIKWKVQLLNTQLKHWQAWFQMMGSEQLAEHMATAQQFPQLADSPKRHGQSGYRRNPKS